MMALCDEGYLCDVCGEEVETLADSDLYLAYVLGEVVFEELPNRAERHVRCNPTQAQFIVDARFDPVTVTGDFDKRVLDTEYVANREFQVTRAWGRLQELPGLNLPVTEYPLSTEES